jgi:hypothetical protein
MKLCLIRYINNFTYSYRIPWLKRSSNKWSSKRNIARPLIFW